MIVNDKWVKRYFMAMALLWLVFIILTPVSKAELAKPNGDGPLVTATFFDSDLREAIKEVSLQTGVTIVIDDNVKGVITMDLKKVPLEKALRMMVSGGGYMYRLVDDYYVVGLPDTRSPIFPLLCETKIYYFKNISIDSAKALLPDVYRNYVRFDPEKAIASINAPTSIINAIMADLAQIDGVKVQVRIKALVTEVQNDAIKELGTNLMDFSTTADNVRRSGEINPQTGLYTLSGNGSFGYLMAQINLLHEEKKATVQADPVLIVSEGKTGQLFVGDKRTIILQALNSNSSNESETVEAGITLKVTPRVFSDYMELAVSQIVSGIAEEETDRILVKTREFDSVVRITPGQTIMVAGLSQKLSNSDDAKTPILGDIPILRFFFQKKTSQQTDSQLLIFLTAEVVK